MMGKTSIEWVKGDDGTQGQTWNPIRGCSKISPGCENCYAMLIASRFSDEGQPYHGLAKRGPANWTGQLRIIERMILAPIHRKVPTTYFVNSMSDLFHERMPFAVIDKLLAVMWEAHWHTFQVLTKRADVMAEFFADPMRKSKIAVAAWELLHARDREKAKLVTFDDIYDELTWPLPNLWLGVSVENHGYFDRIEHLLKTPAAVRFISAEPLLERTDFGLRNWASIDRDDCRMDWIIVGGESGRKARPCDVGWIRRIVKDSRFAGVPCFVKQLGSRPVEDGVPLRLRSSKGVDPNEWPEELRVREMPRREEALA